MKIIDIEKNIRVEDIVDLVELQCSEAFTYKREELGIRCVGSFQIEGRYTTTHEVKDVKEAFEFDVFAANEKLTEEPFSITFNHYDYKIEEDTLILYLHFHVYGLVEEEKEEASSEEEEEIDISMMEELFDTQDNVSTSYSFVVVKELDTYASIAERYGVDEKQLKEVNQEKQLIVQNLLVLPK